MKTVTYRKGDIEYAIATQKQVSFGLAANYFRYWARSKERTPPKSGDVRLIGNVLMFADDPYYFSTFIGGTYFVAWLPVDPKVRQDEKAHAIWLANL